MVAGQTPGSGRQRRAAKLAAALTAALWLSAGSASAEKMQLTPENMLKVSLMLLERQQPGTALQFAEALLQRDPADVDALLVKSRAQRDLGQYRPATASARLAWTHADTDREKFGAAMAVAQGMASDGQKFRSQLWLRRAMHEAPDAAARAMAQRDFMYVRSRSRLSLRFDLSIRPSSNVNGGSSEEILDFYGIPLVLSGDAQALSGWAAQGGLTARWRLTESEAAKTDLRFGLTARRVSLSDSARDKAPEARAGDYAYTAVELGLDHIWKAYGGEARASATLGHNWYGGEDMSHYGRLELGFGRAVAENTIGSIGLNLERQNRLDIGARSADIVELQLGAQHRLANRDRLGFGLTLRETASDASEIDHSAARLDLDWARATPVWGTSLSLGVSAELRDYDRSPYGPSGREDTRLSAQMSLAFRNIDYMGFIPVMTLTAEKTDSNISLYRSESVGVGFSIRSQF